jgi:integrase/recombinase XerD
MREETEGERTYCHRVRWVFRLLHLGGSRIAEMGGKKMGQFFSRRDTAGTLRWWLTIHGKAFKQRLMPATRGMMTELSDHMRISGFSALPSHGENTPLVVPIGQSQTPLSRAPIR